MADTERPPISVDTEGELRDRLNSLSPQDTSWEPLIVQDEIGDQIDFALREGAVQGYRNYLEEGPRNFGVAPQNAAKQDFRNFLEVGPRN